MSRTITPATVARLADAVASDRYAAGAPTGPAVHVQIRSGLLTVDPVEARRLAHALLDAIGEPSEAEAIVRDLAIAGSIVRRCAHPDGVRWECALCGDDASDHTNPDCPYRRARAFMDRAGWEDQR